jgi:hypothetical protein
VQPQVAEEPEPQTWLVAQQVPLAQVWPVPQAAHAAPPVPQAVADWEANAMQLPLLQQPLGQQVLPQIWLVGQQVKLPRLPTQVVPLAQQPPPTVWLRQTGLVEAKPIPQVLPLGQQTPLAVQVWPAGQAAHVAPPVPHSDAHWEGVWRQWPVVLSQQPVGQLVALQTQAPFTHAWPLGQAEPVEPQTHAPLVQLSAVVPHTTQACPLLPQAVRVLPATQVPLRQQPPLQRLVALHAEVQVPLLHASSAGQSVSALQPQTPVAKQMWPAPLVVQLTQVTPPVPQVVVLNV